MTDPVSDPLEGVHIAVAILQPGDVVILRYPEDWKVEWVEDVKEVIVDRLPDGVDCVAIPKSVEVEALRRKS